MEIHIICTKQRHWVCCLFNESYVRNDPVNKKDPSGKDWYYDFAAQMWVQTFGDPCIIDPALCASGGVFAFDLATSQSFMNFNSVINEEVAQYMQAQDIAATSNCIQSWINGIFNNSIATVQGVTEEIGGHWNFNVQIQFSSEDAAQDFIKDWQAAGDNGFSPATRYGSDSSGYALHLENVGNVEQVNGIWTLQATAHIDLGNPDDGLTGILMHVGVDGVVGWMFQILLGGNIDPSSSSCPY